MAMATAWLAGSSTRGSRRDGTAATPARPWPSRATPPAPEAEACLLAASALATPARTMLLHMLKDKEIDAPPPSSASTHPPSPLRTRHRGGRPCSDRRVPHPAITGHGEPQQTTPFELDQSGSYVGKRSMMYEAHGEALVLCWVLLYEFMTVHMLTTCMRCVLYI
ncbi:hypothetical protein EJB05_45278, partial [Eragrostis curvula]